MLELVKIFTERLKQKQLSELSGCDPREPSFSSWRNVTCTGRGEWSCHVHADYQGDINGVNHKRNLASLIHKS